jgi:hypothetical protein
LVGCFAGTLDRPFIVDDNAYVVRDRIADRLALGLWQALGIEVNSAGIV